MSSKKITPKKNRRRFTAEQKAEVLAKHFKENTSPSDLCDELKITPSAFFNWRNQALENLPRALTSEGRKAPSREQELEAKIAALEAKLAKKDNVIAWLSEDNIALKKKHGDL